MRKLFPVAIAALAATAAYAQTPAPKEEVPAPRQPRAAVPGPNAEPGIPDGVIGKEPDYAVHEHMPEASHDQLAVIGAELASEDGKPIGKVENILLDQQGQALALIIGVNKLFGLSQEHIELPWDKVRLERKDAAVGFVTPLSKDELNALAKFSPPKRQPG